MKHQTLQLNDFTFQELFHHDGLKRLDQTFLNHLKNQNELLFNDLLAYRQETKTFSDQTRSELLIQCAQVLESFLANFFHIEEAVLASQILTTSNNPLSIFKKYYVLKH